MITDFRGKYDFLSNFYYYNGTSVEHIYQAAKAETISDYLMILRADTPAKAKKLGRTIKIRKSWDEIKLIVMEEALRHKFSNRDLAIKLVQTYPQKIVEQNDWGDTFWGVCKGIGHNHLGLLLMRVRDQFLDTSISVKNSMDDTILY